MHHLAVCRL